MPSRSASLRAMARPTAPAPMTCAKRAGVSVSYSHGIWHGAEMLTTCVKSAGLATDDEKSR